MAQILRLKPIFTDEQAEVLAGLFDEEVATKADLERLRMATKIEIDALKLELKADIEKLRLEVERDVKSLENRILNRMMTLFIGQGIAVVSLVVTLEKLIA